MNELLVSNFCKFISTNSWFGNQFQHFYQIGTLLFAVEQEPTLKHHPHDKQYHCDVTI
jgi:hypothetical protein